MSAFHPLRTFRRRPLSTHSGHCAMRRRSADWETMKLAPFLVALFSLFVLVRALITGSASTDGQGLLRDDIPKIYWSIVVAGAGIVSVSIYVAFGG